MSADRDEPARSAMLAEIKALCEASKGICASSYGTDVKVQYSFCFPDGKRCVLRHLALIIIKAK